NLSSVIDENLLPTTDIVEPVLLSQARLHLVRVQIQALINHLVHPHQVILSPVPAIVLVQKQVRLRHLHLQVIQIQVLRLMKIKHLRMTLIREMVQAPVPIQ
ncbi:hypothetical protein, partial [Ligilactobacillus acidipiscis]|uniref:hypothetical protein n=1 Tax=Ligilactobacillus acidipiscis TaxID=89059 RepID=UPI000B1A3DCB